MRANSRISDVEVLRTLAVLFVIFQHLRNLFPWQLPELNAFYSSFGGTFGVDLFFAVSGFVIARDLIPRLSEVSGASMQARVVAAFWLRRAWRLLPSAWLWLGLILLAVLFFNDSGVFGSLGANIEASIAGIFNFANVRFAQTFMRSEYGASFIYWSLSLEEQFYLLFPLLILLLRKHLVWLLLALAVLQIATPRQHLYLMMFRTDALALGILLAMWSRHPSWHTAGRYLKRLGRPACQLIMLLSVVLMAILSAPGAPGHAVGMIAVLSAILVFVAAHDHDMLLGPGKLKSISTWCGERSYALYLIHVPAFFLTRELFYRLDPEQPYSELLIIAYLSCAALILLVATELNFRLLETPLRRYGKGLSTRLLHTNTNPISEGRPFIMPSEARHSG